MGLLNPEVGQAVTRLLHHIDGSLPQTEDVLTRDLGLLAWRASCAVGILRIDVDVAAIVAALVTL